MPMYEFQCQKCGVVLEAVVPIADRDAPREHECGGILKRTVVAAFRLGAASFQPGAVMSDGQFVPGHFGKSARKKGGWHRP